MIRYGLLLVLFLSLAARLDGQPLASDLAEGWRASGAYLTWTSALPENQGRRVQVFYTCQATPPSRPS